MKIRRMIQSLAVASLVAVGAAPATATGNSYTVSVGGSSAAGSHPITATTAGTVMWRLPTLATSCTSAGVPVSPPSSVPSGSDVNDILALAKVSFTGCSLVGGVLPVTTVGPWKFHGTTPASPGQTDTIAGHIDGFSATWTNPICRFTVSGEATASFDEVAQRLRIAETGFTGNLKVSNVRGCLGQVMNGQSVDLTATFNLASPDGAINLS